MLKKILLLLVIISFSAFSEDKFEINREFNIFTSNNAEGYFKPLVTSIQESFTTGLYTTADYKESWSFGLNITAMQLYIPSSQMSFNASLPEGYADYRRTKTALMRNGKVIERVYGSTSQPTFYGGKSTPIFSSPNFNPEDSILKTVTFMEGINSDKMIGIPAVQFFLGLPSRTQINFRYWMTPQLNDLSVSYLGLGINQNIDKFYDFLPEDMALAANFSYHSFNINPGISLNAYSLGLHFSKFYENGFTLYSGLQFEGGSGGFEGVREQDDNNSFNDSPFNEIRNGEDLIFDLESGNSFRLLGGVSYRLGFLELHADAAYATQPIVSAGISLWFYDGYVNPLDTIDVPEKYLVKKSILKNQPMPVAEVDLTGVPDIIPEQPDVVDMNLETKPEVVIPVPIVKEKLDITAVGVVGGKEYNIVPIKIEEYRSRQIRPILPYVFFEHNSADIPERYELLVKSETKTFSTDDDLKGSGIMGTYYNSMNVIAERMNVFTKAKLTLIGCNSNTDEEKNNIKLSKQRAQNIKKYFTDVWGIDEKRISIKGRNLPKIKSNIKKEDGISENRRVEIIASDIRVTDPVMIDDTLRKVYPPIVRFKTTNKLSFKPETWSIENISDNRYLQAFHGKEYPDEIRDWNIDNDQKALAKIKNSIQYRLKVVDDMGKQLTTQLKEIPVEILTIKEKSERKEGDTIVNVYNLILFDYNSTKLGPTNKKIIKFINKETPKGAFVKVTGYTDRMGAEDYNLRLATNRAKATAKPIRAKNKVAVGVGEYELLYNNDLPEGRFYCRTVKVIVKYIDK